MKKLIIKYKNIAEMFNKYLSKLWSFLLIKGKTRDLLIKIFRPTLFAFGTLIVLTMFSDYTELFTLFGRSFVFPFFVSFFAFPLFLFYFVFLERPKNVEFVFKTGLKIFAFACFIYFAIALIQQPFFEGYKNSSPLKVYFESTVKYFYDFITILFFVFYAKTINNKTISIFLYFMILLWIFLALIQFIIFKTHNEFVSNIYDSLDILKIIPNSGRFLKQASFRAYGFSREPASSWIFISFLSIPFLSKKVLMAKTIIKKILNCLLLLMLLFCAILTKSPTLFLGMTFSLFSIMIYLALDGAIKFKTAIVAFASLIAVIVSLFIIPFTRDIIVSQIFNKLLNINDYSSAERYSSIYNNLAIFITMPLFGCGDGLQGFYYFKNVFNSQLGQNYGVYSMYFRNPSLITGGSALPSIIGGFGIAGVILVFLIYRFNYKICLKEKDNLLLYFYRIGIVTSLVCMFTTLHFHHNFELLFIMFAPLAFYSEQNRTCNMRISGALFEKIDI